MARTISYGAETAVVVLREKRAGTVTMPNARTKAADLDQSARFATIYVAHVAEDAETFDRVVAFYEGHDLSTARKEFEAKLGPADRVGLSNGYRVWSWERNLVHVDLRGYSAGVCIARRTASDPPPEEVQQVETADTDRGRD